MILGRDIQTNAVVQVSDQDRRRGMYAIGKTGTGKSNFLLTLIAQDIKAGQSVVVIDPHGQLIDAVLDRLPLVPERCIYLNPYDFQYPFGLNLFQLGSTPNLLTANAGAEKALDIIQKAWMAEKDHGWGRTISEPLFEICKVFVEVPGTPYNLVDMQPFLEDESFRRKVLDECTNQSLRHFWEHTYNPNWSEAALARIRHFVGRPLVHSIFGQSRTSIDFRDVLDNGKVLLVRLNPREIGPTSMSLIGQVVLDKILAETFKRASRPEESLRPYSLYIDEFQHFSRPDLAEMFTEVRKYAAQVLVAHQTRNQIDPIMATATKSAGNLIGFGINSTDARELGPDFGDDGIVRPENTQLPLLREPMDHLIRRKHGDEKINNFLHWHVEKLFALGAELAGARKKAESKGNFLMPYDPIFDIQTTLNSYLYSVMSRTPPHPGLVEIFCIVAPHFGLDEPPIPKFPEHDLLYWYHDGPDKVLADTRFPDNMDNPEAFMAASNRRAEAMERFNKAREVQQARWKREDEQVKAATERRDQYRGERKGLVEQCLRTLLTSERLETDWTPLADLQQRYELPWLGVPQICRFITGLIYTARVVKTRPLRATSAFDVDLSRRFTAVDALIKMPPYHALVNLVQGPSRLYATIAIPKAPQDPLPRAAQQREEIVASTRATYCMRLVDVDLHIRTRQQIPSSPERGTPRVRRSLKTPQQAPD